MKASRKNLSVKLVALAVQGAVAALATMPMMAAAEDDDVAALTNPTNVVEIGVGGVSKDSTKFGEYNGLNKNDPYVVGNLGVRGGDAGYSVGGSNRVAIGGNYAAIGTTTNVASPSSTIARPATRTDAMPIMLNSTASARTDA